MKELSFGFLVLFFFGMFSCIDETAVVEEIILFEEIGFGGDYYIDIDEDGVDDFWIGGIVWSGSGQNISSSHIRPDHDNAFLYIEQDSGYLYSSIDTTITLDTMMPFFRMDIHDKVSCVEYDSPNLEITKVEGEWYHSIALEDDVQIESKRWSSNQKSFVIRSAPPSEPMDDHWASEMDTFKQSVYTRKLDCNLLDIGDSAFYYLKTSKDDVHTIGRMLIRRDSEDGHMIQSLTIAN